MSIGDGEWMAIMNKYSLLSANPNQLAQANIDAAQLNQMLAQQAQNIYSVPQQQLDVPKDNARLNQRALQLLTLRLSGVRGNLRLGPDDFLVCHCTTETVYTFFVFNGKSGNTEEDINIFPSDKLLTQLRLVMS